MRLPREGARLTLRARCFCRWDVEKGPFAPLHTMSPVRASCPRPALGLRLAVCHATALCLPTLSGGRGRGGVAVQVRCSFIRAAACAHFELDAGAVEPFTGLRMLDVGCGGGLLCEPMARLGGQVLGVDAVAHSVRVAAAHAARDASVASRVNYRAATAEALVEEGHTFDVVLCLEVRVANPNLGGFGVQRVGGENQSVATPRAARGRSQPPCRRFEIQPC